jgi:hypothetical protein
MEKKKVEKEEVTFSNIQTKSKKEQGQELLKKFIDEEKKLVKGRLRCIETPGEARVFQARKYHPDLAPEFKMFMRDGETYEIPLWYARWLNGIDVTATLLNGKIHSCSHPIHAHLWDEKKGGPVDPNADPAQATVVNSVYIGKHQQRYAFESLEFSM